MSDGREILYIKKLKDPGTADLWDLFTIVLFESMHKKTLQILVESVTFFYEKHLKNSLSPYPRVPGKNSESLS